MNEWNVWDQFWARLLPTRPPLYPDSCLCTLKSSLRGFSEGTQSIFNLTELTDMITMNQWGLLFSVIERIERFVVLRGKLLRWDSRREPGSRLWCHHEVRQDVMRSPAVTGHHCSFSAPNNRESFLLCFCTVFSRCVTLDVHLNIHTSTLWWCWTDFQCRATVTCCHRPVTSWLNFDFF